MNPDQQPLISPEILEKRIAIPGLLAKLTYKDPDKAIHYMRVWGEKKMPITTLYEQLVQLTEGG